MRFQGGQIDVTGGQGGEEGYKPCQTAKKEQKKRFEGSFCGSTISVDMFSTPRPNDAV